MLTHLEIIGFDLAGCHVAQSAGATRIELCARPDLGGTTPDRHLIATAVAQMHVPVYVMVRPRGGDFCYSDNEFTEMLDSARFCAELGAAGVVFGILTQSGAVDSLRCAQLVAAAHPLPATFHRAIDVAAEPLAALEQIITLGFERILTSGQKPTALEGAALIKTMINQAAGRIVIMPGSGVTAHNALKIKELTGAMELHASAKCTDPETGLYAGVDAGEVMLMAGLVARRP